MESMRLVQALNALHSNVWALLIIAAGVALALHGDKGEGESLIAIGAAVFRSNPADAPVVEATTQGK